MIYSLQISNDALVCRAVAQHARAAFIFLFAVCSCFLFAVVFLFAICSCFFVCSVQLFFFVCTVYLVFVSSEVYTYNNISSKFHFVCSVVPSWPPYMTGASAKFLYKQIICCKHINNKIFFAIH